MKRNVFHTTLIAGILAGALIPLGCSSLNSSGSSSDYVGPGGLSQDVSDLPDPSAPLGKTRNDSTTLRLAATPYGGGRKIAESPERLLAQANSYFEQKRYHDASRLYKKYLETPEGKTAPSELLALAHYRIGFFERNKMFFKEAAKEFQLAVQYAPQNNEYVFALAKTSYEAEDYLTADQQFVELLNRDPSYPEGQYYYGLTLLESVNRTNALQPLTNAVGELEARAMLTDKYYAQGEVERGLQSEEQLLQVATRLGRQVPELKHKAKAFGLPSEPSAMVASAPRESYADALLARADLPSAPIATPSYSTIAPSFGSATPSGSAYAPTTEPVPAVAPATETTAPSFSSYAPSATENAAAPTIPTTEGFGSYEPIPPATETAPVEIPAPVEVPAPIEVPAPAEVSTLEPVPVDYAALDAPSASPLGSDFPSIPTTESAPIDVPAPTFVPLPISDDPVFVDPNYGVGSGDSDESQAAPPVAEEDFAFATSGTPAFAPVQVAAAPSDAVPQNAPVSQVPAPSVRNGAGSAGRLPDNSMFSF